MACRILRAPVLARTVQRHIACSSSTPSCPELVKAPSSVILQKRNYNNYLTHGEFAELKDPSDGTEFAKEALYAEVLDVSPEGKLRRARQDHYDEILRMPTPNHKLYLINVERGRDPLMYIGSLHYNSLELYGYATRTFHRMEDCAESPIKVPKELSAAVENIIEASNRTPRMGSNRKEAQEAREINLVSGILNAVRHVCKLRDTTILEKPRIEAFWKHPSFKTNLDEDRYDDKETFSPWFQYKEEAALLISSEEPLQPLVPTNAEEIRRADFETFDYFPEEFGMFTKKHRMVTAPGYWYEAAQNPLVVVNCLSKVMPSSLDPSVSTDHLSTEDRRRRLAAHGLMTNFALTVGAACNHGFTIYHDVTRPFVSQSIVSDGQTWHFSKYQLNTMAFDSDFPQERQNLAWSSQEMKLFDSCDNGRVQGLNETVLAQIMDTLQAPRKAVENPSPYVNLDVEEDFLDRGRALYRHISARTFNEHEYLHFELPLWVKIYKMHKDAPVAPLLKFDRTKFGRIYQYSKKMYEEEMQEVKDRLKSRARDKLFGRYPLRRIVNSTPRRR